MAFPTVEAVLTQGFATAATSHDVTLPATVNADELLVILFTSRYEDIGPVDPRPFTAPSGWTTLAESGVDWGGSEPGGGNSVPVMFAVKADGTEGGTTATVGMSASLEAVAHVYRISGWGGTISSDIDLTTTTGTSTTSPDPPSVTAGWGGSADNLYIAAIMAADDDESFTAAPTNYTNLQSQVSGAGTNSGCEIGSARREYASDSDNPGTFTTSGGEGYAAATLVIEPGSSGSGADTTAPTLSSASASATGATTADASVDSNEAGTGDCVWTESATAPSGPQIQAGTDENDVAAAASDLNVTLASPGTVSFSATGLTAGTEYYAHMAVEDAAGNVATVTAGPFRTMTPSTVAAVEDEAGATSESVTVHTSVPASEDEAFVEPPDTTIYIRGAEAAALSDETATADALVRLFSTLAATEDETLAISASSSSGATVVTSEPVNASEDEAAAVAPSVRIYSTAPAAVDAALAVVASVTVHTTAAAETDEAAALTAVVSATLVGSADMTFTAAARSMEHTAAARSFEHTAA